MRPIDSIQEKTRPLADSTLRADLPADVFAILANVSGMARPDVLTLILADQRSRWLTGSPVETERYLELLPDLAGDPEARLALVAGELRAREEAGMGLTLEDFVRRFPELVGPITAIFETIREHDHAGGDPPPVDDNVTEPFGRAGDGRAEDCRGEPEFIDRYRILRVLGQGGFGKVYLARDELLGRPVAIKVPRRDRVFRDQDVDAFLREARILAGLDHEHIVPVYDVGCTPDGHCFVVSKLIDGESLTSRDGDLPADYGRVARLMAAVADALFYAHQHGLVHRDVKPANLLIDRAGKAYLADFGLALREEDFGRVERLAGTPAYMSPEQVRGEGHRVDGRTDIFSLGIVLYELMSGAHPFGDGEPSTIMRRIAHEDPVPPRRVVAGIPRELERICLRALAPRASDRYATARELADELKLYAEGAAVAAPRLDAVGGQQAVDIPEDAYAGSARTSRFVRVIPKGLRSFDTDDADFFLGLLHGPRDRDGLPESVRFWKARIEAVDSFPVGLIYGPSGCGKSSMVKAGLLPLLAPRVITIYEVATSDLEPRLLARLRRACPGIPPGTTLAEALTEIRRGTVLSPGTKLLIVLDQFEQWLHARKEGPETELVRALRQCDGERLQALIMVRVDFWMASSRFMRQLEVRVVEGENAAAVDLFPPVHARKVLAAFGVAFGALPALPAAMTADQESFLDRAVAMITREGSVMPVRLALFAELVKGRPWSTATLAGLGGAVGIGVRFLDETFIVAAAPPEHRHHCEAASRVLAALLPGPGADIKGHVRSHQDLLDAAGYRDDPGRFESLMRILDAETRLLTPIVPADLDEGAGGDPDRSGTTLPEDQRYYQLTHDYLVPSIREWLGRQQRETRRGRAELRLAERASLWGAKPERKQLPSLLEWASIRAFTDPASWSVPQREMMRAATRNHLARGGRALLAGVALGVALLFVRGKIDEDHHRAQAHGLVGHLLDADSVKVPSIVAELAKYHRWADPELRRAVEDPAIGPVSRRHARMALLSVDPGQGPALLGVLLEAEPDEFRIVRDALEPHRAGLIPRLWQVVESPESPVDSAFRAAVALASFDPESELWAGRAGVLARQLAAQPSLLVPAWVEILRPVRTHLVPPLAEMVRDRNVDNPLVASILAGYAEDRPELMADLVGDAGPGEFQVLLASKWKDGPGAPLALGSALDRLLAAYGAGAQDLTAARIANTAIALLRLGRADVVWPLLREGPDPRVRCYLIDRMGPLGCDPTTLVDRLRREPDGSTRTALVLALGRCGSDQLPVIRRSDLAPEILALYKDDPDPAMHAAAGWLIRTWGRSARAEAAVAGLATGCVEEKRRWYLGRGRQAMALLPGQGEFQMGSPDDEPSRRNNETRRIVRILPFDIATTEVTVGQFRLFLDERPDLRERYARYERVDPDLPQTEVSWYEAVAYCNWLSEREGLPPEQWCYVPNADGRYAEGMQVAADFLARRGYRLPLETEWEYACRGGTITSQCFGESEDLLLRYACCLVNSQEGPFPVGSLMPNAFGLFDVHGNVFQMVPGRRRS